MQQFFFNCENFNYDTSTQCSFQNSINRPFRLFQYLALVTGKLLASSHPPLPPADPGKNCYYDSAVGVCPTAQPLESCGGGGGAA